MTETTNDPLDNNLLNKLRAAVLGANDGIVSTSSVLMGVAGATSNHTAIITAGMAALVAGALSMAVGEYVSVSSQSDAEKAFIEREKDILKNQPEQQKRELAEEYQAHGISEETSMVIAEELSRVDPLKSHIRMHFGIDSDETISPMQAAIASLLAFTVGGLVPFLAIGFAPEAWRIQATVLAVLIALVLTGYISATVGEASRLRAVARVVIGGSVAMGVTYYVGVLFGTTIA